MSVTQNEKAARFRALHDGLGAFVIPNPWDVGSARILAGLGFQALATSSAASASALGRRDHGLTRDEALAHSRLIVDATDLQLERQSQHWAPAKSRVLVRENEAGEVAIHYRGQRLAFRELKAASRALGEGRGAAPSPAPSSPKLRRSMPPASNHPWRKGFQQKQTPDFSGAA